MASVLFQHLSELADKLGIDRVLGDGHGGSLLDDPKDRLALLACPDPQKPSDLDVYKRQVL